MMKEESWKVSLMKLNLRSIECKRIKNKIKALTKKILMKN
jgi:hypothetical protein